jgi:hypothetical protein
MKEMLRLALDAALFRHEAYAQHVVRSDVLKRGLLLLVLVSLLAGVVSFLIGLVGDLRPISPLPSDQEVDGIIRELLASLDPLRQFVDLPFAPDDEVLGYMRPAIRMGLEIAALPTPLPRPVGSILTNLGAFLSLPFGRLAGWIAYGVWVLLAAKLLGGRATVAQMLGTTALYAVPHVLDILQFVPCLGGVIGLATTVWGIAIYVKGLSVANEFSVGRAVLATLLPALVLLLLGLLGVLVALVAAFVTG